MKRILFALLLILGSELSIRMINQSMTPAPATLPARPLRDVAQQLAGWSSQEIELDPRVFASSGAGDSVKRVYQNAAGSQISFFAGTWLDYPPSIPHSPEICYPTNGWEIVSREPVKVTPDQEPAFVARLMTCRKRSQTVSVLYWIDIDGHRTYDDESIRGALQRRRRDGTPRPPLVKVMLQHNAPDPAAAQRDLVNVAAAVATELSALSK